MMNGISSSSGYFGQMQMQSMGQKPGQEGKFAKLDTDGNGGIDTSELQTITDKISQRTGQAVSVEEVSATYDADNDGLLNQDETNTMMMELREKMGGKQQAGMHSQQNLATAYQAESENDLATTLMEMLSEQAKNKTNYTPFSIEV